MKIPSCPPISDLLASIERQRLGEILTRARAKSTNQYYHWDQLRHHAPPEGLSHEEWWLSLKLTRNIKPIPVEDKYQRPFGYSIPDNLFGLLHHIDSHARGHIAIDETITNPASRDRYVVSSLIEEAITSSQLEGASTTRKVAVDMLRSGRNPRDRSERMILNNYLAMQKIRDLVDRQLTPELVLTLHRILTTDTLDNPDAAGRLQAPEDKRVKVYDDRDGTMLHEPPSAEELSDRLDAMCAFANGEFDSDGFVHPIVRAIALHFWLAYDHPFEDGNGRTARALFYWSMLRAEYWLFEYVSISSLLRRAPAKYARAFLYTETDDNDLTYFLLHQLDVCSRAIDELYAYLKRKAQEVRKLERSLRAVEEFNYRQRALLAHALRNPDARYTIESHRRSHNIAYATARADLLGLASKKLLVEQKAGRRIVYLVQPDLEVTLSGV